MNEIKGPLHSESLHHSSQQVLRKGIPGRREEDSSQSEEHYQHVFSSFTATDVLHSYYKSVQKQPVTGQLSIT